jgi:hypothetical protein
MMYNHVRNVKYRPQRRGSTLKLSDKYYSGREVQRKLAITEPALRNLVNQKKIKKYVPPGRQYAVYLKSEIDRFAEKWEAFLMAKEPPKTVFRLGKVEDAPAERDLDVRAIGPNGMPVELRQAWLAVNSESDYEVYHDNRLVAFLWLVPIKQEIIEPFIRGEIHWRDIVPERDIDTYEPGKSVDLFVQGIASEPDVDETTRTHYMLVLLRGAAEELKKLGRRGIIIQKIYARTQTPTGIAMSIHTGMQEYEPLPRTGKLVRFVLDVEKSDSYLAKIYKEGLEEWKKEHGKSDHREKAYIKTDSVDGRKPAKTRDARRQNGIGPKPPTRSTSHTTKTS